MNNQSIGRQSDGGLNASMPIFHFGPETLHRSHPPLVGIDSTRPSATQNAVIEAILDDALGRGRPPVATLIAHGDSKLESLAVTRGIGVTVYEATNGIREGSLEFPRAAATPLVLEGFADRAVGDRALLAAAHDALEPGELLIIATSTSGVAHSARDALGTALFAEGFERARYRWTEDHRLVVEAVRAAGPRPYERPQRLTIVVPAYNEAATFSDVMDTLLAKTIEGVELDFIVVESNSTDGTRDKVLSYREHPRVTVILEDRPSGKGHAVRAGLARATGDFILIQDADLEYDVDDYDVLLEPLRSFEASFVLGIRTRTDGARLGVRHFDGQVFVSRMMNVGNTLFLMLFNVVYRQRLRDPFTMYKVFRRDCIYRMRLECNRFDFDWELTAKMLRSGYTPVELPVSYQSRSFTEGKKISVLADPLSWIRAALRYRTAPLEID